MKIVFLNGGLANQVFQYIFYRYAQINVPEEEWFLDDSFFFVHDVHNGYELEKVFDLKPNLLSNYFDRDVWDYMIQLKKEQDKSIPQILLENGTDIKMLAEGNSADLWNPFSGEKRQFDPERFDPDIIYLPGTVYYHIYSINTVCFDAIKDRMRTELVFPEIKDPQNLGYLEKIRNTRSCSVHIRRGDYVQIGIANPDEFYKYGINEMLKLDKDLTLFVFTDDVGYCRSHMHEQGLDLPKETVFVEGNVKDKSFRDAQLMSNCRYMINGNSSFCFLAALLNENLEMFISSAENRQVKV